MATGTIKSTAWKLLWTNPNPSAQFAAQTVSLSLAQYSEFLITFLVYSSNTVFYTQHYWDKNIRTQAMTVFAGKFTRRNAIISDAGIEFLDGGQDNTYSSASLTVNNSYMIPVEIKAK